ITACHIDGIDRGIAFDTDQLDGRVDPVDAVGIDKHIGVVLVVADNHTGPSLVGQIRPQSAGGYVAATIAATQAHDRGLVNIQMAEENAVFGSFEVGDAVDGRAICVRVGVASFEDKLIAAGTTGQVVLALSADQYIVASTAVDLVVAV